MSIELELRDQMQTAAEQLKRLEQDNPWKQQPASDPTLYLAGIQNVHTETLKAIERIAGDERFSSLHKRQQIDSEAQTALAKIEASRESVLKSLDEETAKLKVQAYQSPAPSPEQAAALAYTRDALMRRWGNMNVPQMRDEWEAALDAGDTVTMRVYRDFASGAKAVRSRRGTEIATSVFADLEARTDEALQSPEAKKASERLKAIPDDRMQVEMAYNRAKYDLAHIDAAGRVRKNAGVLASW